MQPGEVIAERFEIEQRVGSGGMGEVYRARDRTSGEVVAVKVLLERNAAGAARFLREAKTPGVIVAIRLLPRERDIALYCLQSGVIEASRTLAAILGRRFDA